MSANKPPNKSAKALYRPIGMIGSLISGAVAGAIFRQIWKLARPKADKKRAPGALESEAGLAEVLLAAALQGAIFAAVQALVDRGGARGFQRIFGQWPGN